MIQQSVQTLCLISLAVFTIRTESIETEVFIRVPQFTPQNIFPTIASAWSASHEGASYYAEETSLYIAEAPEFGELWKFYYETSSFVKFSKVVSITVDSDYVAYRRTSTSAPQLSQGSTENCTLDVASDEFQLERIYLQRTNDTIRVYVCVVDEEDAPVPISMDLSIHRMQATLIHLQSTDEEDFSLGTAVILISKNSLQGRLFAHKCPTNEEEQANLEIMEGINDSFSAPKGSMYVCYISASNGTKDEIYATQDSFQFQVLEYTLEGELVLGDIYWGAPTTPEYGNVEITLIDGLQVNDTEFQLTQGYLNYTLNLTTGISDTQASVRSRDYQYWVNVSSLYQHGGRAFDFTNQNEIWDYNNDGFQEIIGDSIIVQLPSVDYFDVLPAGEFGRSEDLEIASVEDIGFQFKVIANDSEFGVATVSTTASAKVHVRASPQALNGFNCPNASLLSAPEDLGVYVDVPGISIRPYDNADVFSMLVKLAPVSECGQAYVRAQISNVTLDFAEATVAVSALYDVALEDYLFLRYVNSSTWTSQALCLEHGCSLSIWLRGPRTAINSVLAGLRFSSLCSDESSVLGINITAINPYTSTDENNVCYAELREGKDSSSSSTGSGSDSGTDTTSDTSSDYSAASIPIYVKLAVGIVGTAILAKLVLKSNSFLHKGCQRLSSRQTWCSPSSSAARDPHLPTLPRCGTYDDSGGVATPQALTVV